MAAHDRYAFVDNDDPDLGRQAAAYRTHLLTRGKQARRQRALARIEADLVQAQNDFELLHARHRQFADQLRDESLSASTIESYVIRKQKAEAEIEALRAKIARLQKDAHTLRTRLIRY
ncbi:MAG: hypothetical protein U0516_01705 [Candidatus Saccharibacteria bacterium]